MNAVQSTVKDIAEAERYGLNNALAFVQHFEKPYMLDKEAHVFGLPKMPEDKEKHGKVNDRKA